MTSDQAADDPVSAFDAKLTELRALYTQLHASGRLEALTRRHYGRYLTTSAEQWRDCRCFQDRRALLSDLPKGGIAVELGTQRGLGARIILDSVQPQKLFTIDNSYAAFQHARFNAELATGRLELIEGSSWGKLAEFPDAHFDLIYIGAGHDYASVKRDSEVAIRKVKPSGTIVFNDFNVFSALEFMPYGVARAAIELAEAHRLRFSHFAFDFLGYHDVALRHF